MGLRPYSLAEQRFFTNGRIIVRGSAGTCCQGKRADYLLRYPHDAATPGMHFVRAKGPALSQPMDKYGATTPAEFVAVATEFFFE